MLILLGILNVAGIMRWITETATPVDDHEHVATFHAHPHRYGDNVHSHAHGPTASARGHAEEDTPLARLEHRLRPLPRLPDRDL